jgi:WD40 repeat protein
MQAADCLICVWDVKSLAARRSLSLVATLEGHTGWVTSLAVRSDNKLLASASTDGTAKIWDLSRLTTPLGTIRECAASNLMRGLRADQDQGDLVARLATAESGHLAAVRRRRRDDLERRIACPGYERDRTLLQVCWGVNTSSAFDHLAFDAL